jgi:hypothetical protein
LVIGHFQIQNLHQSNTATISTPQTSPSQGGIEGGINSTKFVTTTASNLKMLAHLLYPAINDGAIQSATIDRRFLTAGAVPMAFVTAHTFHKQLHW